MVTQGINCWADSQNQEGDILLSNLEYKYWALEIKLG